jgi:heat shock protein HslJ
MRTVTIMLSSLGLLAACSQEAGDAVPQADTGAAAAPAAEEPAPDSAGDTALPVGDWQLVSIGGEAPAEGLDRPTLLVQGDGRVAGFAGVNRYTGSLGGPEDRLFGPMPTTMMAGPPEAMALEARFTQAMGAATDFRLEGGTLVLVSNEGDLVFERAD